MYKIGVDLGGTNIAAGIVDENGKIVLSGSTPTLAGRPYQEIIADMGKLVCVELDAIHERISCLVVIDDNSLLPRAAVSRAIHAYGIPSNSPVVHVWLSDRSALKRKECTRHRLRECN